REYLRERGGKAGASPEALRRGGGGIYNPRGSDRVWGDGGGHPQAPGAPFEYPFRKHPQNGYLVPGATPPVGFVRPIRRRAHRAIYTLPRAFLEPKIDGRRTFFEWLSAGRYTCQNERGTMAMVAKGPIKEMYFGFNVRNLFLRIDFTTPAGGALADFDALRIGFVEPANLEVLVHDPGSAARRVELLHGGKSSKPADVLVGIDQIAELAIPFARLGVQVDGPLQ